MRQYNEVECGIFRAKKEIKYWLTNILMNVDETEKRTKITGKLVLESMLNTIQVFDLFGEILPDNDSRTIELSCVGYEYFKDGWRPYYTYTIEESFI